MVASQGLRYSTAPLGAESTERPLSVRAAMMCIVMLSILGWTAILLPAWVVTQ